ncbi:MAG: phytoene desaturase family protein [Candidatus Methylomirabilales bacterium]
MPAEAGGPAAARQGEAGVQEVLPLPPADPPAPAPQAAPLPAPAAPAGPVDVAVIGAGLAGLAFGCLAARAGKSVVVLERSPAPGGVCRPLLRKDLPFDVGASLLLRAGSQGPLAELARRLAIELPLRPLDPVVQVALPRHRLSFAADPGQWQAEIAREAPAEAAAWQAVWGELESLQAARERLLAELPALPPARWGERLRAWRLLTFREPAVRQASGTTFRATLGRHGLGPVGQRVLEALLWYTLVRDAGECTTLEAALALGAFRGRAATTAGGSLARVLQADLETDGGRLRLGTEVLQLTPERGGTIALATRQGETLRARRVVGAVAPADLRRLLPPRRSWQPASPLEGAWPASHVAEMLLVAVPGEYLPSELGEHCFCIPDAGRPACGENCIVLHARQPDAPGELRPLALARFVPPGGRPDFPRSMLRALDGVVPGVADVAALCEPVAPAEAAAHWGRPEAAARYAVEAPEWLGRRGRSPRTGWPGIAALGDWTFPGRQVPDVVEAALRLADELLA